MSDLPARHATTIRAVRPSEYAAVPKYAWLDECADPRYVARKNAALIARGFPPVCRVLQPNRKGIDQAEAYRYEILQLTEQGHTPTVICRILHKLRGAHFCHETIARALALWKREESHDD
jgi:hypothetical protein